MAAFPLLSPRIHPTHDATIASCEYLLGIEMGLSRAGKELLPERSHAILSLKALTVWLRPSILKSAVVTHQPHDRVDVMAVEGVVEALHDFHHAASTGVCWTLWAHGPALRDGGAGGAASNGSRLSCGRLARRRKGVGRIPCPVRGTTCRVH